MTDEKRPRKILIINLPPEPYITDELRNVETVFGERDCDLILDLSRVTRVSSLTLCGLIKLRKMVMDCNHSLTLCNTSRVTKGIFVTSGFDAIFQGVATQTLAVEYNRESTETGTISLTGFGDAGRPQRRSYKRLRLGRKSNITVFVHHKVREGCFRLAQGFLIDISEGGAQIGVKGSTAIDLRKQQLVELHIRTESDKSGAALKAQVREVVSSADSNDMCLGLKFIGLEENTTGRNFISQLCNRTGLYYETNEALQL